MNKLFLLLLITYSTYACNQVPDRINHKSRSYSLIKGPRLDHYIKIKGFPKPEKKNTGCHRGYVAEWQLEDGVLSLKKVKMHAHNGSEFDFKEFKDKKASFYTGEIRFVNKNNQSISVKIKDGNIVEEFHTCLNAYSMNYYIEAKQQFEKRNYIYAASLYYKVLTDYPDFFANDLISIYYVSCLKWLGLDDISNQKYKRLLEEHPTWSKLSYYNTMLNSVLSSGNPNIEDEENLFGVDLFIPWIHKISVDKHVADELIQVIENGDLFNKDCSKFDILNTNFPFLDKGAGDKYGVYLHRSF